MESIKRRQFLKLCALGMAAHSLPACNTSRDSSFRRPNIVYINADDLGWTDLSCLGSRYYETPNIDNFATQGITFTNAYAPAANCAPSRACCLTGQYTPRHGIYTVGNSDRGDSRDRKLIPVKNTITLGSEHVTIASVLKNAGYLTGHIGKWHLSPDPLLFGFDTNIAGCHWGSPSGGGYHSPYKYPNCEQDKKGEYLTDRLGMEAVKFITENKDHPFFLHFATYTVHKPLQGKTEYIEKYKVKPASKAHNNPDYAAMVQSLDENVGRILTCLDELGLTQNTLVLFTSDNGGVWGVSKQWPLRAGKGAYYEGGIREPLFVRWPGRIKPGSSCDVPVCGIDYFPTFLEAAGIDKPGGIVLDGLSLVPLLKNTGTLADRALYWHFPIYLEKYGEGSPETRDIKFRTRPGSAIRYHDWKLHEYFEDGGLELYNLVNDISEKNNLCDVEKEKTKELHDMLKAWRQATHAPVPTELNPEYGPG